MLGSFLRVQLRGSGYVPRLFEISPTTQFSGIAYSNAYRPANPRWGRSQCESKDPYMIPDTSQREVDVSNEVFVFWKNTILRPGVFVGLYSMEANRFEVLGFSGSFLSEEKD